MTEQVRRRVIRMMQPGICRWVDYMVMPVLSRIYAWKDMRRLGYRRFRVVHSEWFDFYGPEYPQYGIVYELTRNASGIEDREGR